MIAVAIVSFACGAIFGFLTAGEMLMKMLARRRERYGP